MYDLGKNNESILNDYHHLSHQLEKHFSKSTRKCCFIFPIKNRRNTEWHFSIRSPLSKIDKSPFLHGIMCFSNKDPSKAPTILFTHHNRDNFNYLINGYPTKDVKALALVLDKSFKSVKIGFSDKIIENYIFSILKRAFSWIYSKIYLRENLTKDNIWTLESTICHLLIEIFLNKKPLDHELKSYLVSVHKCQICYLQSKKMSACDFEYSINDSKVNCSTEVNYDYESKLNQVINLDEKVRRLKQFNVNNHVIFGLELSNFGFLNLLYVSILTFSYEFWENIKKTIISLCSFYGVTLSLVFFFCVRLLYKLLSNSYLLNGSMPEHHEVHVLIEKIILKLLQ